MASLDLREAWNRISSQYQRQCALPTDCAHYGTLAPDESRLQLLGTVSGKRVLELGCGGGQCSIAFARQGADCTAVDQSDEQIAYARRLAEQEDVTVGFHRAEMIEFLSGQPAGAYDLAFSAYAFQYVEDLRALFVGVRRVLRPTGLFVFSLDHPFSDITGTEGDRVVVASSYFDAGRTEWDWELPSPGVRVPFHSYHRTVGEILNLLVAAGFRVERLLEPEPVAEHDCWAGAADSERFSRVPATIIWKARAE